MQLDSDPRRDVPLACRVRRLELLTPVNRCARQPLFARLLSRTLPAVLFFSVAYNHVAPWIAEIARSAPGLRYLHLVLPSLDERLIVSVFPSCSIVTTCVDDYSECSRKAVR